MRPRWPLLLWDVENVDFPPPHLFGVTEAVEDDVPLIVFTMNKWTTELLMRDKKLDGVR